MANDRDVVGWVSKEWTCGSARDYTGCDCSVKANSTEGERGDDIVNPSQKSPTVLRDEIACVEEVTSRLIKNQCEYSPHPAVTDATSTSGENVLAEKKARSRSLEQAPLRVPVIQQEPCTLVGHPQNTLLNKKRKLSTSQPAPEDPIHACSNTSSEEDESDTQSFLCSALEEDEFHFDFWKDVDSDNPDGLSRHDWCLSAPNFHVHATEIAKIEWNIEARRVHIAMRKNPVDAPADGKPRGDVMASFPRKKSRRRFLFFCRERQMMLVKKVPEELNRMWKSIVSGNLPGPGDYTQQLAV
ncbi:hypothetical protein FANTH_4020 [Fusarium anthophilum]|uniref:Uncharacterized protein n=1 Tax=Fusarium anthophilum TaxID=48485 RepID=A0A8H4ZQG2_9HYPO|nr:hypothetical protein FANTH_4020 [Fusarium anthophilum]